MSDEMKSEMVSRRRLFSLVGLAAASVVAVPAAMLTVSEAEAQTAGMERRQERRRSRRERREDRRDRRQERRESRRERRRTGGTPAQ
jgi:Ni/Co efflux regulator RcnB